MKMVKDLGPTLGRRSFLVGAAALGAITGLDLRRMALAADGATFTFGRPMETVQFDPHASQLSSSWHIQHLAVETLVTMGQDKTIQPGLATAWEWQGSTLVFTLREGVKFANGRDMTAEDVSASLERALTTKGNPWGLILRNRTAIKADGNKVSIEFSSPNNAALSALCATLTCILPMKEVADGSYDPTGEMFTGTGPFYVTEHIANDRWVLTANPHYWGGAPKVQTLVVRTIPSAQGLVAALTDGSIDAAMFNGDPDAEALLAAVPNVQTSVMETTDFAYLGLNCLGPDTPFADKRVRQAVALAVDRQQIIDFAMAGQAKLSYGWTQWGLTDDSKLALRDRDLERARALMAEAAPARTSLRYLIRAGSINEQVAQVLKQNLAEIGLDCQLETVDGGVWAKRVWGSSPSDMDLTNSSYTGFAHPLVTAHWWAPELSQFTAGYVPENPAYTAALNVATMEAVGDEAVNAALQTLYGIINEEAVKIPLCQMTDTIAWRADRVDMVPSTFETQNDVMNGIEAWSVKA
jgi:peptide/nickel transport system substrate-binding protein